MINIKWVTSPKIFPEYEQKMVQANVPARPKQWMCFLIPTLLCDTVS
uniref:Uncharacterized protein n=1 Tax=Rhizophora mucronata TaxID=61149 RepID=A0A2P2MU36_RHIMU